LIAGSLLSASTALSGHVLAAFAVIVFAAAAAALNQTIYTSGSPHSILRSHKEIIFHVHIVVLPQFLAVHVCAQLAFGCLNGHCSGPSD